MNISDVEDIDNQINFLEKIATNSNIKIDSFVKELSETIYTLIPGMNQNMFGIRVFHLDQVGRIETRKLLSFGKFFIENKGENKLYRNTCRQDFLTPFLIRQLHPVIGSKLITYDQFMQTDFFNSYCNRSGINIYDVLSMSYHGIFTSRSYVVIYLFSDKRDSFSNQDAETISILSPLIFASLMKIKGKRDVNLKNYANFAHLCNKCKKNNSVELIKALSIQPKKKKTAEELAKLLGLSEKDVNNLLTYFYRQCNIKRIKKNNKKNLLIKQLKIPGIFRSPYIDDFELTSEIIKDNYNFRHFNLFNLCFEERVIGLNKCLRK